MATTKQGATDVMAARQQIERSLDALLSKTSGKYREVSRASILASIERATAW